MRSNKLHNYTVYTVGCGVVWAIILIVVGTTADADTRKTVFTVFGGWVIGWVSATIARSVYPPPAHKSS